MKKKITIACLIGVITLLMTSSAFADLGSYRFDLTIGHSQSSSNVRKSDYEQKAYVTITDTTAHSDDIITFRVRRASDGAAATEAKNGIAWGTSLPFTLNYIISGGGVPNTYYYLNGYQDKDSAFPGGIVVLGQWNP